jgi:Transposase DDE domain group 1
MPTECNRDLFGYEVVEGRQVVAAFDGGEVTSDAGALLLGATDRAIGLVARFASSFDDGRVQSQVEHSVAAMVAQRVFGIALGYEDLVDHDQLRHDPVLATLAGKLTARRQDCAPLAGKSTLNRLEHAPSTPCRYHKIGHDAVAIEGLFVTLFLEAHRTPPERIVLDLDATDDPLHGHQEGRFFHGYYDCYCYLPLYIFCGRHLLAAKLRRSNIAASAGAVDEVERLVGQIRESWPRVKIVLRADSGFARDELMTWCEAHGVDYLFGLARNDRLVGAITEDLAAAAAESLARGGPARRFADFAWRTLDSWSRARRVVAKAEHLPKGSNPRFVVTSLPAGEILARTLYEDVYCARGEVENRIKEQQLDLFAGRTSAATMRANQLRLWFASFAYVLIEALRRIGLRFTQFATATCGTIRLKLLKIGAQVRRSVRRIKVAMASACPFQTEYHLAYLYLKRAAAF